MNKDIGFINRPDLLEEYPDENGVMFYSLKEDMKFFNGVNELLVRKAWNQTVFMTNLASTPKFLHWLIPPDNKYYKYPSVLHDWLYSQKDVPRSFADKMFRLAIISEYKRKIAIETEEHHKLRYRFKSAVVGWSFWAGVRLFGRWFRG